MCRDVVVMLSWGGGVVEGWWSCRCCFQRVGRGAGTPADALRCVGMLLGLYCELNYKIKKKIWRTCPLNLDVMGLSKGGGVVVVVFDASRRGGVVEGWWCCR